MGFMCRFAETGTSNHPRFKPSLARGAVRTAPRPTVSKRIDRNAPHSGGVYIAQISAELIETRALAMLVRVGPRPEYRASSGCLGGASILRCPEIFLEDDHPSEIVFVYWVSGGSQ